MLEIKNDLSEVIINCGDRQDEECVVKMLIAMINIISYKLTTHKILIIKSASVQAGDRDVSKITSKIKSILDNKKIENIVITDNKRNALKKVRSSLCTAGIYICKRNCNLSISFLGANERKLALSIFLKMRKVLNL